MSGAAFAEGIRTLVQARAARRHPAAERPPAAEPVPARPADPLEEIAGASLAEEGGETLLTIRRDVAELLPGVDVATELTRALETMMALDPEDVDPGLRPARGARLPDLAVLDLETTGFWGCPILLAGVLHVEDGVLITRQLVARDYPEERPLLRATLAHLAARKVLVTFNGKSYDVPCLKERCVMHRIPHGVIPRLRHVDILHPARRRFRGCFEDCRLTTLERRVVGFTRAGDVPSRDIPALFHRFVATGDTGELRPVLHHGRVDLLTTARLFAALAPRLPGE